MLCIINQDKVIEIFFNVDEFCKEFTEFISQKHIEEKSPRSNRKPCLSESEIMTLLILYHLSGFKCFQYYYQQCVLKTMKTYFPKALSYEWFISLLPRVTFHLFAFVQKCRCVADQGENYVDSKPLVVCHNRRIYQNKVFKGMTARGKSSTGWFYGLKLFLVINPVGQLVKFTLTPGNVADNNVELLKKLFKGLKGKMFGDKGFITKIASYFQENGLHIITKIRNNMKNKLMATEDKFYLRKRGVIESVLDIMTSICDIEHTRHRSPVNAIAHLFAGLAAYSYLDRLPSIWNRKNNKLNAI